MRSIKYFIGMLSVLVLAACGGGSNDNPAVEPASPAVVQNVQPIIVDGGPTGVENVPYVTVTICQPGNVTACQTIDHIQVDTGSSGLRLIASALPAGFTLPALNDSTGNPIAECEQFADGYTWGSVKQGDLRIAGELASKISIHIIGDDAFPSVPAGCSNTLAAENTVGTFKANGLIGISIFNKDCGSRCAADAPEGNYYVCPNGLCVTTAVDIDSQVGNPVASFAQDNNGTLIKMAAIGPNGAATAAGSLIFGINTQPDNMLRDVNIYGLDESGNFATDYNGQIMPGFLDSGSGALIFSDDNIQKCTLKTNFYCPASSLNLRAVNTGTNGVNGVVNFSVANADLLTSSNPPNFSLSNYASDSDFFPAIQDKFDWGLPFFFGRSVYTALDGALAGGVEGPYVAY